MRNSEGNVISGSSEDETKVIRKEKKVNVTNPLIQRSKNRGSKVNAEEQSSSDDSEGDLRFGMM